MTDKTDAELMAELGSNREALAPLLARYTPLVYRVAAAILRDRAEAEDVTQDVFLEIYQRACLFDPSRGSVRGWILQYAYHRSVRRKNTLRRRVAYGAEPLDQVQAFATRSARGLTAVERRWLIRSGLACLPARQRRTIELACYEELSLREIAERLCVSLGCARHYYYRGLARLQDWVDRETDRASRQAAPTVAARSNP